MRASRSPSSAPALRSSLAPADGHRVYPPAVLKDYVFTSESVNEGHPDKVCDQISDAILDAILAEDPDSRVACEALIKTGLVVIAGEITSRARVEFGEIAKKVIRDIGYTTAESGFNCDSCAIVTAIERQSLDISQGVTEGEGLFKEQGAGDQGMMFGYACDETREYMPFAIYTAHRIGQRLGEARRSGLLPFLRPDGKCQVTVAYAIGVADPVSVLVDTFGSGALPDEKIATIVREVFDLKPAAIIRTLGLKRPIYQRTASYGHFGRVAEGPYFTWERTDRVGDLRSAAGLGRAAGR